MLELGGIRSARQSRQRAVLPASAALAPPTALAPTPLPHTQPPPPHAVCSGPSRKRSLPAEECGAASGQVAALRVKLEAGRAEASSVQRGGCHSSASGGGVAAARAVVSRQGGLDGRREDCAASARCGVAFVSVRALRQQTRQRLEEKRAEAEAEAGRSGAAQAGEGTEVAEMRSAAQSVPGPVGEPCLELFEPLCSHAVPSPLPAAFPPAPFHSAAVNFKSFHKARAIGASLLSSSAPPRSVSSSSAPRPHSASVRVVLEDSGDGCSSEAEVAAVRQSEQLERLTAQLDGGSIGHGQRGPMTGKRKR